MRPRELRSQFNRPQPPEMPEIQPNYAREIEEAKTYITGTYDLPPTFQDMAKVKAQKTAGWLSREVKETIDDFKRQRDLFYKVGFSVLAVSAVLTAFQYITPAIQQGQSYEQQQ